VSYRSLRWVNMTGQSVSQRVQNPSGGTLRVDKDGPLVERVKAGDHAAFTELVRRYEGKVYQLALRLTGNEMDAMDVIQDVFLSVYQKIHTFRGAAAFSSWLYRITANAAFAKLNQRRRAASVSIDDVLPVVEEQSAEVSTEWSLKPDAVLSNKEARGALEKAIDSLPDDFRTVVILRDVQNMSNQDVADSLNISVPAVKSRLHRARLILRKKLGEYVNGN
jgi:RNA polymerase sigma-70 factor, ECF subfamily